MVLCVLTGCNSGGGDDSAPRTSRLALQIITANPPVNTGLRQTAVPDQALRVAPGDRLFVTRIVVSISAADISTITEAFDVGANQQEEVTVALSQPVRLGPSRHIIVTASNAQGKTFLKATPR
jgi:hypothetical protein